MILRVRLHHSLGNHEDENRICASRPEQQEQSSTRSADSVSIPRNHSAAAANRGIGLRGPTRESPLTDDRYSRLLFSGMDDLHCQRVDSDASQPVDHSSVSPGTVRVSGTAHLHVPDDHLYLCDMDHLFSKLKGAQPSWLCGRRASCLPGEILNQAGRPVAPQARCLCSTRA